MWTAYVVCCRVYKSPNVGTLIEYFFVSSDGLCEDKHWLALGNPFVFYFVRV